MTRESLKKIGASLTIILGLALSACGGDTSAENGDPNGGPTITDGDTPGGKAASAIIEEANSSGIHGTAIFGANQDQVTLMVQIAGAPPGEHAIHIHENADCSDNAMAAGAHWNPTGEPHGLLGQGPAHLGDIGNITVTDEGTATFLFKTDKWTLGTGESNDVAGHAIVIHDSVDDFTTQPSGGAGTRIACGVIKMQENYQ